MRVAPAGRFRWISEAGGHAKPGPGRSLYELRGTTYRYAREGARLCSNCGGVLMAHPDGEPKSECPMCRAQPAPAHNQGGTDG